MDHDEVGLGCLVWAHPVKKLFNTTGGGGGRRPGRYVVLPTNKKIYFL
jgi:hypothetical protein